MNKKIIISLILLFIAPFAVYIWFAVLNSDVWQISHDDRRGFIIDDMVNTNIVQPQTFVSLESSSFYFTIPDGVIPRKGQKYDLHQTEIEKAKEIFKYIYKPDSIILRRAELKYNTHCTPCHGVTGHADGSVITLVETSPDEEGFPSPPDLTSSETRAKSDARLYHILSAGQNLMFPVDYKLDDFDRRALVYFIRKMQREADE
ncbi:MAG: c-type cytochrome [Candidatus Kapaibacterium sp.]